MGGGCRHSRGSRNTSTGWEGITSALKVFTARLEGRTAGCSSPTTGSAMTSSSEVRTVTCWSRMCRVSSPRGMGIAESLW